MRGNQVPLLRQPLQMNSVVLADLLGDLRERLQMDPDFGPPSKPKPSSIICLPYLW